MSGNDLEQAAAALRAAHADGAIAPLLHALEATDAVGAYAIQAINTRCRVKTGRRIVGRKVGSTAKAVQAQLGIDQPDFGVLFDDMAIADGSVLPAAKVLQPKAEAEVALVLGRDIDAVDATCKMIASAVDHAVAAIEIVDSRIADWKIGFADTAADNGSSVFMWSARSAGRSPGSTSTPAAWCCRSMVQSPRWVPARPASAIRSTPPPGWRAPSLPWASPCAPGSGALGPMVSIQPGDEVVARPGGLGAASFRYEGSR